MSGSRAAGLPSEIQRQRTWLSGLCVLLPLFFVIVLTIFVLGPGVPWDQPILDWYRHHRTPTLSLLARDLSVIGNLGVLPLITLALSVSLWLLRRKAQAWFLVLSVCGSLLLNVTEKIIVQRPRPNVLQAVLHEPGFSFPSGHAMTNAAFGIALVYVFWHTRYRWLATVLGLGWAIIIGICRNYLGVHYPSDVLVGQLSSLAFVTVVYLLMTRRTGTWPRGSALTPVGTPTTAPAER